MRVLSEGRGLARLAPGKGDTGGRVVMATWGYCFVRCFNFDCDLLASRGEVRYSVPFYTVNGRNPKS